MKESDTTNPPPRPTSSRPAPPEQAFAATPLGRRLMGLLESGSASGRAVADCLLRNPVRMAALGIEDAAEAAGVSAASLSRFARVLGFEGYASLRNAVAEDLQAVLRPVEKLRDSLHRGVPGRERLAEGIEASLAGLRRTADGLDLAAVAEAAALIPQARRAYVMGFGLSSHVAALLALGLQPFCPNLVNVVQFGGTEVAAGRLVGLGPEDLLVAISFPRYARDAIHLTDFARARGARVIAITDSPASPLAQRAHALLVADGAHPVLSSSMASAVLVAEALVTAVMTSSVENLRHAQELTEALSSYLYNP